MTRLEVLRRILYRHRLRRLQPVKEEFMKEWLDDTEVYEEIASIKILSVEASYKELMHTETLTERLTEVDKPHG